ncbi:single-stranded DNA-binding protein [Bifidobacterium sp. UTCIF-37]|uniref:Single-stranded DNA-binding protein n=1 Tax=Bifidobacterium callitrichos TaxID=762209 RepID=A0A2T3GBK1_9BIFI|nr:MULTISPECIES: single-stranded DNA-binding protein [Bifidobacterium]KAA8815480.1 single-stranded DNA-binding protein [Bifidobacterium callitrichos]PST46857.1 single-stranded DNA-binding protein [Bifidobacterium callitrichos]TPF86060.1 single-stranded DNA-binding protein [Bifidobacterium sp. UTCIF-37]TPF88215.1 single-stranded DNA-binding protein [Bifidobacterium sp. UTCIF-38]
MAGETTITIIGNLTADPELRTIGSGATVASFTIASTPRTYNRQSGQFEDGQALFMRCSAWRDLADHCAQSLSKGMRVIAQGRLQQRSYQAQDGSNRTVVEMTIDEIGPSLRYATAQVTRQSSGQGGFVGRQGGNGGFAGNNGGYGNGGNGGYSGGASYSGGNGYQGGGSFGGGQQTAAQAPSAPAQSQAPAADPWSSDAGSGSSFSTFGGSSDFGGGSDDDPEF